MHQMLFFIAKLLIRWLPSVTIPVQGKPYLTRYYLLLRDWKWFGVYIHHFHMSDPDRELHNHPFYLPGETNTITKDIYHRVELLDPNEGAWTLFVVGPRRREWTFLDPDTGEIKSRQEVNPESIP